MTTPISIGICVGLEQAQRVAPGYDYLELPVASVLMPLEDEATYAPQRQTLAALQPAVRAFNIFVASQVRLTGPGVDWDQVEGYVKRAVARAADLGGKVIGFGSGGARSVPEGYSRALAWGQLVRFANLCADQAAIHGIRIALEPLNVRESNILNTYLEAVQLARDVDRQEIGVVADIYHFMMDAEPLDHIEQAPEKLIHVHLADTGRRYPGSGTYPLERLFEILRQIGYHGGASIECHWGDDFAGESARALAFLRDLAA